MKVVAIFVCFFFSVALACPGETGPGCDCDGKVCIIKFLTFFASYSFLKGYHCDNASEKCCNVDGNHFCAPTWQNCYGFQFEDFDKSKASEPTEKEVVSGVVGKYFYFLRGTLFFISFFSRLKKAMC